MSLGPLFTPLQHSITLCNSLAKLFSTFGLVRFLCLCVVIIFLVSNLPVVPTEASNFRHLAHTGKKSRRETFSLSTAKSVDRNPLIAPVTGAGIFRRGILLGSNGKGKDNIPQGP